jgi:hypothetical protein
VAGEGDMVESLTEVYRVKPALGLQRYCTGDWVSGNGFTWSTVPFY